jgi:O-antigen ligase
MTTGVVWWSPQTVPTSAAASHRDSDVKPAFAAIVAFTLILLLSPQNWFPVLKPFRIAFLAAGLGVASLIWERWRHRRPLGLGREMLICLALVGWAFLTLPLSYWPGGSMSILTDLYIKAVIVFWLLANVVTTARRLRLLAIVLMFCTILLAGTAVKNFATGAFLAESDPVARIVGYEGMLSSNPNDLALMLNLLIPLGIALLLSAQKTSARILWLTILGINVVGVIVTFSRGGFLALATIAIIYFIKLMRRPGSDRKWAVAMVMLAILSLPLVPESYVDRLATVTDIESDPTNSSQARWRDMVAAAHFVTEHPIIGAGIGMDVLALNEVRGSWWKQVHNVYLEYAVDLGLPGAVLFLMLLYSVFRAVNSSLRRLAHKDELRALFFLAEALQVSLIAFAVASFFHPVAYHFYFYYIAGLALAVRSIVDSSLDSLRSEV